MTSAIQRYIDDLDKPDVLGQPGVELAFCATGPGGGQDPHCGSGGAARPTVDTGPIEKKLEDARLAMNAAYKAFRKDQTNDALRAERNRTSSAYKSAQRELAKARKSEVVERVSRDPLKPGDTVGDWKTGRDKHNFGKEDLTQLGIKAFDKMSVDERKAMTSYIGAGYSVMNVIARDGEAAAATKLHTTEKNIAPHAANIAHLDNAIANAGQQLPVGTHLFRGLKDSKLTEGLRPGDVVHDKSFMSSSVSPKVAENFAVHVAGGKMQQGPLLHLVVTKATNVLPISNKHSGLKESEAIIPRATSFKVTAVRVLASGQHIVQAELL